ncbi:MAG TPA: trehalose-phosphatase [Arachnia sp.]|nr:trehalose-phosphatase [Arachnia sp.]
MTTWHARTSVAHDFLAAAAAAPDSVLVALDFDGTLAPIVDDPETSAMQPEAADALAGLGPKVGQVAIITGRPVAKVRQLGQLERRVGLGGVIVLGQYGAERWDARTGLETPPEAPQSVAVATVQIERALADLGLPGVHLEDKGQAIGIHVRRCPDPAAAFATLKPIAAGIAEANGLVLEPGRHVLELRSSSMTKGDALRALIEETGATVVAMCGDDLGDLPAFDLLRELRDEGVTTCIVVSGSHELPALTDHADVVADGPAGVAAWLDALSRHLP